MVVCKFFQQGYCRFGQSCRFEHVYGSKYTYHAQAPPAAQQSEVTDDQLRQQVLADATAALQGRQWPLSAYAPFKGKPNLPGLSDLSPDEARLFIYEARANNTLDQAMAYMNNLQQEATAKYSQLLQPTPAIISVFRSLYNGEIPPSPYSSAQQSGSHFGGSTNDAATSVFKSAVHNNSVFGQNTPAPSVFGVQAVPNSVFGNQNTSSMPAQSIFAQATQSVFGNNQAPPQANQSIFGNNQAETQANPASIFASASQNLFAAGNPQSQATSPFSNTGAQTPSSIFQKPETQGQSVFGPPAGGNTGSPFGQNPANAFAQPNMDSFFGQQGATTNAFGQSASIFGQSSSIFGQTASSNDSGVYRQMDQLSAEEIESFKGDSFQLGCIPELPPPHSLCV